MDKPLHVLKDETENRIIFHKSTNLGPILNMNRLDRNEAPKDLSFGRKVASVPTDVLDAWIREGIDYRKISRDPSMRKKFYEKLNSREFCGFKTYDGGIGK
jgi:hypothetical protein